MLLIVLALLAIKTCNDNNLFGQKKYQNFPNLMKNKVPMHSGIKDWILKGKYGVLQIEELVYGDSMNCQKLTFWNIFLIIKIKGPYNSNYGGYKRKICTRR